MSSSDESEVEVSEVSEDEVSSEVDEVEVSSRGGVLCGWSRAAEQTLRLEQRRLDENRT